jgi:glutathione synthase/RimK-type ligase-like ATP-grasp enzyme
MSRHLLVVERPQRWDLALPGVHVVAARDYLTEPEYAGLRRAKVFNLCRTYGYQTIGYYVSLLAAARGHRPLPSVTTIQDLRSSALLRIVSEDLQREVQRALGPLKTDRMLISIYFGRNVAKRYDRLSQALFTHFPAPFLKAEFSRANGRWRLDSLRPIASAEIPEGHREFVKERARRYFARPHIGRRAEFRYDLAILVNPDEVDAPSDEVAIRRFCKSAERHGMRPDIIGREDLARVAEYDALFLRETTYVNHHTYRFARKAEVEGLVVIDDPTSIVRCTNKVYLAELFDRHDIPCPRTMVVHRDNADEVGATLGFPCVLKRPDSSFSQGVVKANDEAELATQLDAFFEKSELVVAQEYTPSNFDWRVGVIDGKPLFACRYYMASGHWQIYKPPGSSGRRWGKVDTVAIEDAPARMVEIAVRACAPIGNGLYGVDVKQIGERFLVMEVNDNPSIEAGCEDLIIKEELYDTVMRTILERIERRGGRGGP